MDTSIQLTQSEKLKISTTDVSKEIKRQLKNEFPGCKFSVRTEYYSGGSSISIDVLETNFKVKQYFEDLSETAIYNYTVYYTHRTLEELRKLVECSHNQLSDNVGSDDEYNPDVWNNGCFLTREGFDFIKRICEIAHHYNWDNSDPQTDYFDVNYYVHLSLGKWDMPFRQVEL